MPCASAIPLRECRSGRGGCVQGGDLQAFCLQRQGREAHCAAAERELQPLCEGTQLLHLCYEGIARVRTPQLAFACPLPKHMHATAVLPSSSSIHHRRWLLPLLATHCMQSTAECEHTAACIAVQFAACCSLLHSKSPAIIREKGCCDEPLSAAHTFKATQQN